jgi:trans-2,3-dihydro-3-hydroxyanthranilate isomerase
MPARSYRYLVVDVFTEVAFRGNPLAVFPDASALSDDEMQTLARELNLSETSFILPAVKPGHAARVRIFTPNSEMEFAGHPTIGTAYVLSALGRIPPDATSFVLEENIGPVPIRLERRADPFLAWLQTPPIRFEASYDRDACAEALGLGAGDLLGDYPAQVVSAGNPFLFVALRDPSAVDRAELDVRAIERAAPSFSANGVFVFAPVPAGVYARMFAPMSGIREDPATGSATGPLAAYLVEHGLIEKRDGLHFINEQGTKMQRRSLIHALLHVSGDTLQTVEIGGSVVGVIEATVELG